MDWNGLYPQLLVPISYITHTHTLKNKTHTRRLNNDGGTPRKPLTFWASPKMRRTWSTRSWEPSCTLERWSSSKGVAKNRLNKKEKRKDTQNLSLFFSLLQNSLFILAFFFFLIFKCKKERDQIIGYTSCTKKLRQFFYALSSPLFQILASLETEKKREKNINYFYRFKNWTLKKKNSATRTRLRQEWTKTLPSTKTEWNTTFLLKKKNLTNHISPLSCLQFFH